MKELKDIITAYDKAVSQNKQTVLATVVQVEGSSYRRPGARMLITADGEITGAISGGCLEGDALRKAQRAMHLHLAGAAHLAENIRRKVEAMPLSYGDRQIPLTVSVGVACVNAMPEVDPQALISAADQMLYQAKQNGRNRCALHSEARGTAPPTRQVIKPGLLQPAPASSEQT